MASLDRSVWPSCMQKHLLSSGIAVTSLREPLIWREKNERLHIEWDLHFFFGYKPRLGIIWLLWMYQNAQSTVTTR